jgi:hypothetical protein
MTLTEIIRCRLAMWLDRQKDRVDELGEWVSPASEVWERFDQRQRRLGKYKWLDAED